MTGNSFLNTYLIVAGTSYTYYVKAKNANGNINNSNGTLSKTATSCGSARMANSTNSEAEIKLYPNPNNGKFVLSLNKQVENKASYVIYDVTGKSIQNKELNIKDMNSEIEVDISNFPAGIYMVNITIDNQEFTKKVIKN